MRLPRSAAEVLRDHVVLEIESIDRMYLNMYVPHLQRDLGVVGFFRRHRHCPMISGALMAPMTQSFVEKIEAFACESGLPFTAATARRNLVTEGVDLNALVGREFRIGAVMLRGIRLCEPCAYLAKISFPETLRGLVHKGGLRAQIVSAGTIRVGDPVKAV